MQETYSVIGVMSGSSLDGLDIALISFKKDQQAWSFHLAKSETIPHNPTIFQQLNKSHLLSKSEQEDLDQAYGTWIAEQVSYFRKNNTVNLIAVHGHTVIHEPTKKLSWQLGSGEVIAQITNTPTVSDFRLKDINAGGQGAPLVPFGDFMLFNDFDACLNLGGIANVSIRDTKTAWDVCPCNQVLNFYAEALGYPYDKGGQLAQKGVMRKSFTDRLRSIPYFNQLPPKSLPNQFLSHSLLDKVDPHDGLRTYLSFISKQLARDLSFYNKPDASLLVTGGGAHNSYLIESIKHALQSWEIVIPSNEIIDFKEAIIFGFLGLKRWLGEINVLHTVTGASYDTSSGVIHYPND